MEKFVERTLLYDFYGELLTARQREVYEGIVLEDYSLSEMAEDLGVSRQSIHDMVKRCDSALQGYEDRLHLVERFLNIQKQVHKIQAIAREKSLPDIDAICVEILGEL